jgi:hypothetical protein
VGVVPALPDPSPAAEDLAAPGMLVVAHAFHRPGWVHEEKVDGWWVLAYKDAAGRTPGQPERAGAQSASKLHTQRAPMDVAHAPRVPKYRDEERGL